MNLASKSLTGDDWAISSAFPCGIPSMTSNMTTSPSSFSPMRWASVPPIWPAPINAILLRAMVGKLSTCCRGARRVVVNRLGSGRQGAERQEILPVQILYTLYQQTGGVESRGDIRPSHGRRQMRTGARDRAALGFDNFAGVDRRSLFWTVRQAEIGLRPHLDQPRGREFEFVRLVAFGRGVKLIRLCLRGCQQLHRIIVQRVDQDDEALGLIVPGVIHHRNVLEDDGVEFVSDPKIVDCRQRLLAKIAERKSRNAHRGFRYPHSVALDHQLVWRARMTAGKPPPGFVERGISFRIVRHVPCRHASQLLQPEIGARLKPHDLTMAFEQRNEREK